MRNALGHLATLGATEDRNTLIVFATAPVEGFIVCYCLAKGGVKETCR